MRTSFYFQIGRERIRKAHVARKRAENEVAHLNAIGRYDVAKAEVIVA